MTFNHILFPIDFSEHCRRLNPEVEWLASRFGSRVTLLHVFEIPISWYGTGESPLPDAAWFQTFVDLEKDQLKDYKLGIPENQIQRVLLEGTAGWQITNWAKQNKVDLIVMGSRGLGNVSGLLLGSVAAKVIHDTPCPVWTDSLRHSNRNGRQRTYKNLVCAIDVADESIPLLKFTNTFARELGATVHLVHGVPAAETRPSKYFDFDLHSYLTDSARVTISKLQREADTTFPLDIRACRIADAVSNAALEQNADLIVIGAGRIREVFGRLRTHSYQIIRDAPCPVLSYLPGHEATQFETHDRNMSLTNDEECSLQSVK
ncbi:MAG TPA: universal stress protein [Bryobacteraceae bacterium]|nr:universal stress protein [Bryobacteraceae bacterium]